MEAQALNAFYMCDRWGGRPADDLLGDPLEFALNTFIFQVGIKHENRKAKERDQKREQEKQERDWKNNLNKFK